MAVSFLSTVDGTWGQWSGWSNCDPDCGEGSKHRTRVCSPPSAGEANFQAVTQVDQDAIVKGLLNPKKIQMFILPLSASSGRHVLLFSFWQLIDLKPDKVTIISKSWL